MTKLLGRIDGNGFLDKDSNKARGKDSTSKGITKEKTSAIIKVPKRKMAGYPKSKRNKRRKHTM